MGRPRGKGCKGPQREGKLRARRGGISGIGWREMGSVGKIRKGSAGHASRSKPEGFVTRERPIWQKRGAYASAAQGMRCHRRNPAPPKSPCLTPAHCRFKVDQYNPERLSWKGSGETILWPQRMVSPEYSPECFSQNTPHNHSKTHARGYSGAGMTPFLMAVLISSAVMTE